MHVVHIIANNTSVPYFNSFAERQAKYPGIKFSFVALHKDKPQMLEDMYMRGCDCYWIEFDLGKRKKTMISAFFQLYRLFKKIKPDVVHTHLFDDSLPALFAARLAGVKTRAILKQDTSFHWFYNPIWVWADRFNNYNATHIIPVSDEAKKFVIEKERALPLKVYRVHSGIDIDKVIVQSEADKKFLEEKFGLKDKLVIGTIARLIDWKGYKYIIEAARSIVAKHKNAKFVFIGEGPQRQELEELISRYHLTDNVVFTGWIERKYIPSLLSIMDMYVHAAIMEPFGFVICEAMANGVPLVINRTGVANDILVHKETCFFTEYKNPESIAEGIEWMIENKEIAKSMKEKLKKLARDNFSVDRMLDDFIKVYKGELPASGAR